MRQRVRSLLKFSSCYPTCLRHSHYGTLMPCPFQTSSRQIEGVQGGPFQKPKDASGIERASTRPVRHNNLVRPNPSRPTQARVAITPIHYGCWGLDAVKKSHWSLGSGSFRYDTNCTANVQQITCHNGRARPSCRLVTEVFPRNRNTRAPALPPQKRSTPLPNIPPRFEIKVTAAGQALAPLCFPRSNSGCLAKLTAIPGH